MTEVPGNAPAGSSLRPLVAKQASNRAVWIFGACALIGGTALFASLQSHRAALTTPAITPGLDDDAYVGAGGVATAGNGGSVPPIAIPSDAAASAGLPVMMPPAGPAANDAGFYPPIRRLALAVPYPSALQQAPAVPNFSAAPAPASAPSGPEVVYDANRGRAAPSPVAATEGDGKSAERVQASRFANPATTIPKGTVIQAVLESALDSTRAGMARAIISRDVFSFDGSKVLIAKGSRLIGEYKADLASGQSRALIQWQRLMRPDGVLINLDSPSADPLGRAGVKGKVNTHFFAQFGGTILQTSLNVAEEVAASKLAGSASIYPLPGLYAMPGVSGTSTQTGAKVQPTLTIKQGTSVSVFVAKDLDFTSVEQ